MKFYNVSKDFTITKEKHQADFGIGYNQYSILRGSCVSRCLKSHLGKHWYDQRFTDEVENDFISRRPYQEFGLGISCIFTYLQSVYNKNAILIWKQTVVFFLTPF